MSESSSPKLFAFLKQNELFADLTEEELHSLTPFLRDEMFEKGQWLIREGEASQHLFIIRRGRAEVVKHEKDLKDPQIIGVLEPGDWVGEMAHIERSPRSASVRAFDAVEAVVLLLEELSDSAEHRSVYHKIAPKLTRRISQRLRKTDDTLVQTLKDKLLLLQSNNQASKMIIYTMILFAIFFNVIAAYNNYAGSFRNTINLIFMPSSILLFGAGAVRLIQKSGYPLSFYGLTWHRWGQVAMEAVLATLPLLGLMTLLKWALLRNVPSFAEIPLIALPSQNLSILLIKTIFYLALCPVQELVARGVLQSSFTNFFQGENRVFYAILSSNILFEILHTANDLFLAVFSFIFGIFWGALFEYQRSLVGVTISHMMIGWWGIFGLDILSLAPNPVLY